jgi:two-component system sensor histidine kinase EvgS
MVVFIAEQIQANILLVDDDRMSQIYLRHILEGNGLTVSTADNGQQALDQLDKTHFDAVLMDIQMPVMDGLEATRRIRASTNSFSEIPIIAITSEEYQDHFLTSGMDEYLSKPVNQKDVIAAIRRNLPA